MNQNTDLIETMRIACGVALVLLDEGLPIIHVRRTRVKPVGRKEEDVVQFEIRKARKCLVFHPETKSFHFCHIEWQLSEPGGLEKIADVIKTHCKTSVSSCKNCYIHQAFLAAGEKDPIQMRDIPELLEAKAEELKKASRLLRITAEEIRK